MTGQASRIELRPRRDVLVAYVLAGVALVGVGYWLSGVAGWLAALSGIGFAAYASHELVRRRPRLVLDETGLSWPGHRLGWNEIASLREVSWRQGAARFRFLGIETVRHLAHSRFDRYVFRVDFTVNLRGLERPADGVIDLVEAYSGREVSRLPR